MNMQQSIGPVVNGVDVGALGRVAETMIADADAAAAEFAIATSWKGGCKNRSRQTRMALGGTELERPFGVSSDEPHEMLGDNTAPNPQEILLAGLNACMVVGFVTTAAAQGIVIEQLEVESRGQLDLRGFIDPDSGISPGVDRLHVTFRVKSDAPAEAIEAVIAHVRRSSPNFHQYTHAVPVTTELTRL